eukprot:12853386-Alexandrium_andersonii.AAC.1
MASSSKHSWEQPAHSWEREHRWGDSDEELEDPSGAEAGEVFTELLLSMLWRGQKMSAKAACCLSYWAARAGAAGPVAAYGYNPTAPSGHFQRHIDKVSGMNTKNEEQFMLDVAMHDRHDASRTVHKVP